MKDYYLWKYKFYRLCVWKIRLSYGSEFAVNWKMAITSQFSDMMSSSTFLTLLCFSCQVQLLNKFHVNIINGSGVMTVSFYKGLIRNLEIGDTPVWVLPNIWSLGRVKDTKFGANMPNEMYWKSQYVKVTAFTVSELLRENQQGVKLSPNQIRIKIVTTIPHNCLKQS